MNELFSSKFNFNKNKTRYTLKTKREKYFVTTQARKQKMPTNSHYLLSSSCTTFSNEILFKEKHKHKINTK